MKTKQPMVPIGYIQFIASLLVILVHCGRLAKTVAFISLKSLLCRLAVPFSAAEWLFFKEYPFMAAMVQTTTQALFALVDRVSSLRLVLFRAAKSC